MKSDLFVQRHLGPRQPEVNEMLKKIGVNSVNELVSKTIPTSIIKSETLNLADGISEHAYLERMRFIAAKNKTFKTYMGLGYYNSILVVLRQPVLS